MPSWQNFPVTNAPYNFNAFETLLQDVFRWSLFNKTVVFSQPYVPRLDNQIINITYAWFERILSDEEFALEPVSTIFYPLVPEELMLFSRRAQKASLIESMDPTQPILETAISTIPAIMTSVSPSLFLTSQNAHLIGFLGATKGFLLTIPTARPRFMCSRLEVLRTFTSARLLPYLRSLSLVFF